MGLYEVSGTRLRINIDATNYYILPEIDVQSPNNWEEIVFDLEKPTAINPGEKTITSISLQLDRNGGPTEETVYVDAIRLDDLGNLNNKISSKEIRL